MREKIVSKWRLRKHVSGYQGEIFCQYFKNQKSCPYEELGCMFQHEDSPICRFQEQCLKELCQYKHKDNNEKNEKDVIAETEMSNCCKKCKRKFTNKGDLNNHIKIHEEEEKSDNSMTTDYVSELLTESNCEKCEDKSCDRCIMKEVLKELQEENYYQ